MHKKRKDSWYSIPIKSKIKEPFHVYFTTNFKYQFKNSLINSLIDKIKEKLAICIEKFIFSNIKNIYVNLTVSLQELVNDLSSALIKEFIEAVDLEFKNSEKRKEKFYINKSNVNRTIVTIFGEIIFHRTLLISR